MKMKKICLIVTVSLLLFIAQSQTLSFALDNDQRMLLKADLLIHSDGKYTHDQTNVCRVLLPTSAGGGYTKPFYVKRHIESPSDIMSRDRFVAISTRIILTNRAVFAHAFAGKITVAEAFDAVQCTSTEAAQKSIDFVIFVIMQEQGIQVSILDNASGKKSLDELSWTKLLNL